MYKPCVRSPRVARDQPDIIWMLIRTLGFERHVFYMYVQEGNLEYLQEGDDGMTKYEGKCIFGGIEQDRKRNNPGPQGDTYIQDSKVFCSQVMNRENSERGPWGRNCG